MNSLEKLVMMANQIAANLAQERDPAEATATHMRMFWDPRMQAMITADAAGLSPVAAMAVARLAAFHAGG